MKIPRHGCVTIFVMRPTVILLSFNSEETLGATLMSARQVSGEIFVVDSYSKDGTVELARSLGATVVQHAFEHYGAQRNWAIDNLPISRPWQLHLDADEWMDGQLVAAIEALPDEPQHSGYFLPRYLRFLGRELHHGGMRAPPGTSVCSAPAWAAAKTASTTSTFCSTQEPAASCPVG